MSVETGLLSNWAIAIVFGLVIAALTFLLLVLLCSAVLLGAYYWLGFNHRNETAKMVPADTPMLLSFSPDPRQDLHLRTAQDAQAALALFGAVPEVREAAEQMGDQLAQDYDIQWDRDVMSWIGPEVSLAILDAEAGAGDVPPMILTAATRNQAKSDAFLLKLRQALEDKDTEFAEEEYKGVHVVYAKPDYEGAFAPALATVKGLVVIGSDLGAVHQAIDTGSTKGATRLADQEMYKRVMGQLPGNRLGYFYLSSETLLRELQDVEDQLSLGSLRAMGVSFSLEGDGIRLDYVASVDPESLSAAQLKAAGSRANRRETADLLPSETVVYVTGQDLLSAWETTLASNVDTEEFQHTVDEVRSQTGVDLVEDVIARLSGEYALALLPDSGGLFGQLEVPLGLILVAQVEQPEELKASLDSLSKTLEGEGGALGEEQIDGTAFVVVEDPDGKVMLGYGLKGDVLIIGSSGEMLRAAMKGWNEPLSDDETFRAAAKALPGRATSYLYVDVDGVVRLVYGQMGAGEKADFDENVRPYLEPLRAISVGAEPTDKEGMTKGTVFLTIRQD